MVCGNCCLFVPSSSFGHISFPLVSGIGSCFWVKLTICAWLLDRGQSTAPGGVHYSNQSCFGDSYGSLTLNRISPTDCRPSLFLSSLLQYVLVLSTHPKHFRRVLERNVCIIVLKEESIYYKLSLKCAYWVRGYILQEINVAICVLLFSFGFKIQDAYSVLFLSLSINCLPFHQYLHHFHHQYSYRFSES